MNGFELQLARGRRGLNSKRKRIRKKARRVNKKVSAWLSMCDRVLLAKWKEELTKIRMSDAETYGETYGRSPGWDALFLLREIQSKEETT